MEKPGVYIMPRSFYDLILKQLKMGDFLSSLMDGKYPFEIQHGVINVNGEMEDSVTVTCFGIEHRFTTADGRFIDTHEFNNKGKNDS